MTDSSIFEVDYLDGKLIYYLDESGEAVVTDYFGEAEIFCIPAVLKRSVSDVEISISVAKYIPDDAFQNCTTVKTVVFGADMKLGLFLFGNCINLTNLVSVDCEVWQYEYSFTYQNLAPKELKTFDLVTVDHDTHAEEEYGYDRYACHNHMMSLMLACAVSNDYQRLLALVALGNIEAAINKAIRQDDVALLRHMESIGIPMTSDTPYVPDVSKAIRSHAKQALDFLLSRKIFSVGWSQGSLLYTAVKSGQLELVCKVLRAGASPFSRSPEWDGERLVSDVAKELGQIEMFDAIMRVQRGEDI